MREGKALEFKEAVTNSFLKTVSAFANYGGGSILFGVDDRGHAVGLANPVQSCLDIENKVNDSIVPHPPYSLVVHEADATVELKVSPGRAKPYFYRSKAYRRSDSATIEVDAFELARLILEGRNTSFEELPASDQHPTFSVLAKAFSSHLRLSSFDEDTLKTLGLLGAEGEYNNAAALLADDNEFPGIDVALFGESINVIRQRVTSEGKSVLSEIEEVMSVFDIHYCYEEVVGFRREARERIPREAFRETITNAVVHRLWDVPAHIRVAMFEDHIEVTSPGSLPASLTFEEYLSDKVSVRRNRILADVFLRLGLIEAFGTGILRINDSYAESSSKPRFSVTDNTVTVSLPVLTKDLGLSKDQQLVYDLLSPTRPQSGGALAGQVSFSRSKLTSILKQLVDMGLASTVGSGRGLKYQRT